MQSADRSTTFGTAVGDDGLVNFPGEDSGGDVDDYAGPEVRAFQLFKPFGTSFTYDNITAGTVDAADIDDVFAGISGSDFAADINGDNELDASDADAFIRGVLDTRPGDANLDGLVNLADFGVLRANFGGPGGWATADFNGDGLINLADFGLLRANFGFSRNAAAAGSADFVALYPAQYSELMSLVPEPATAGLLGIVGLAMLRRRR